MLLNGIGMGSFDLFVEKSEMLYAPDDGPVEVYDPDWNDWYAYAQATLPTVAEIDVRVDDEGRYGVSVESIEPG